MAGVAQDLWRPHTVPRNNSAEEHNVTQRNRIVNALYDDEKEYIRCLDLLQDEYIRVLAANKAWIKDMPVVVAPKYQHAVQRLSGTIDILLSVSRVLFVELETCMRNFAKHNDVVSKVFGQNIIGKGALLMYQQYMNIYASMILFMDEERITSKRLKEFLERVRDTQAGGSDLNELVSLPVQRVQQYLNTFQDLLEHTPPSHPDYKGIVSVIADLQPTRDTIWEDNLRTERTREVINIERVLFSTTGQKLSILKADRHVVHKGRFDLVNKISLKAGTEDNTSTINLSVTTTSSVLYLFNTHLYVCVPRENWREFQLHNKEMDEDVDCVLSHDDALDKSPSSSAQEMTGSRHGSLLGSGRKARSVRASPTPSPASSKVSLVSSTSVATSSTLSSQPVYASISSTPSSAGQATLTSSNSMRDSGKSKKKDKDFPADCTLVLNAVLSLKRAKVRDMIPMSGLTHAFSVVVHPDTDKEEKVTIECSSDVEKKQWMSYLSDAIDARRKVVAALKKASSSDVLTPAFKAACRLKEGTANETTLSQRDWKVLVTNSTDVKYDRGDVVFREGDTNTFLYRLVDGGLKVSIGSKELAILSPPALLGEMTFLGKPDMSATVVASQDNTVLSVMEIAFIRQLFRYQPDIAYKFYRNMSANLSSKLRNLPVLTPAEQQHQVKFRLNLTTTTTTSHATIAITITSTHTIR